MPDILNIVTAHRIVIYWIVSAIDWNLDRQSREYGLSTSKDFELVQANWQ